MPLTDWVIALARAHKRRIMVRLVKGAYWDTEVKGGNSFIQRGKRLVFKVAHYQSGEQLAQAVAAAKAKAVTPQKP